MTSRKPTRLAVLLATGLMTSCTTQPMPAQPAAPPLKAIPCVSAPAMTYRAPTNGSELGAWLAGSYQDQPNAVDTPETAKAIRQFNAARAAVCGP
jgi:hypothetical protein